MGLSEIQIKNLEELGQRITKLLLLRYYTTEADERGDYVREVKEKYGFDLDLMFPTIRECRDCRGRK